jgi:hypothetical protein
MSNLVSILCLFLLPMLAAGAVPGESRDTLPQSGSATPSTSIKDFGARSIGHNVSMSGRTLDKNEISVGTLFVGYGLTDTWTVGISPFVLLNYKMYNAVSRWAWDLNSRDRILFQTEYFKTFGNEDEEDRPRREYCSQIPDDNYCRNSKPEYGFTDFKMEAWDGKLTYSRQMASFYRMNITASYYYYIDDERPFSLRMDPQNGDRYAVNLTSLHELRVNKSFFVNLEGGFWGMNYQYPYIHLGATLNLQPEKSHFLAGAGISSTFSPSFPEEKAIRFAGYDSRGAIHPEIQVQFYF